ncbi:MAG: hypothetical protein JSW23_01350 [Planctomycetota bacterium]|nr:MAG: hypothetical protein JSW23_01350 [Planctomycetota bacterium]
MRTDYLKLVVLTAMSFLLVSGLVWAAGEEEEDFWGEDRPRGRQGRLELTDERIEQIMERLKEAEPEKAEELKKLQEEDPNEFKAELRKTMREGFGKRQRERGKKGAKRGHGGGPPGYGPPGYGWPPGYGPPGLGYGVQYGELLGWLDKNYPEEAERLRGMREDRPELYMKRMGLGLRRYGRIMEAEKENPELAAVLKEDLELKQQRDRLLRQIRKATDEQEKEKLVGELNGVVGARFDLIVKRKQMEYEELRKRLERLRREVEKSQANVEKWKDGDYKAANVKARVVELVGVDEEFKWE